jgi:hypothetical protein
MKRIFLMLAAVCGLASADPIGLTAGLGLGFGNVADEAVIGITPQIEFENSFGNLDVYLDAEYAIEFADPNANHDLYLEEELGYNLSFSETSRLSFIVNNQNDFHIAPKAEGNIAGGVIDPAVRYTHTLGFGDLFGQVGLPIAYRNQDAGDDEAGLGVYAKLGWDSVFGLGAELTLNYGIKPDAEYAETELLLTYEQETFYAEVDVVAAKAFKSFTITPEFDYYLGAFTLWTSVEFGNLGGDEDVSISPTIGVKYSF